MFFGNLRNQIKTAGEMLGPQILGRARVVLREPQ
jgi:hypothetical protein